MKKAFFLTSVVVAGIFSGCTTIQTTPVYTDIVDVDVVYDDAAVSRKVVHKIYRGSCNRRVRVIQYRRDNGVYIYPYHTTRYIVVH